MYPKFWKFWKILGIFRICDGESPAKIRRIANFFSQKFAFAPAIRRRKRGALAKNSRREIFANAPEMRQIPS